MRVRALLQVQKTQYVHQLVPRRTTPALEICSILSLQSSACVCTVPVPALSCDARREQQDTNPCCHALVCGHAQAGPNLHVSHKLVMKTHSLILYLNHIWDQFKWFSSARILSGIDASGSLGNETNDERR